MVTTRTKSLSTKSLRPYAASPSRTLWSQSGNSGCRRVPSLCAYTSTFTSQRISTLHQLEQRGGVVEVDTGTRRPGRGWQRPHLLVADLPSRETGAEGVLDELGQRSSRGRRHALGLRQEIVRKVDRRPHASKRTTGASC
jgi:hypothetical protein